MSSRRYVWRLALSAMVFAATARADEVVYINTTREAAQVRIDEALDPDVIELNWATYLFNRDTVGLGALSVALEKARKGAKVRLLFDWLDTYRNPSSLNPQVVYFLESHGVEVRVFGRPKARDFLNPVRGFFKVNNRMHTKLMTFTRTDGRTSGITGGFHMMQENFLMARLRRTARRVSQFLDRDIYFAGQAGEDARAYFMGLWDSDLVEPYMSTKNFVADPSRQAEIGLAFDGAMAKIERLYQSKVWRDQVQQVDGLKVYADKPYLSTQPRSMPDIHQLLLSAKTRLRIMNPYLLMTPALRGVFKDLRARGVEIEVLIPDSFTQDVSLVGVQQEADVDDLLEMGVKILMLRNSQFLHAKTFSVDDRLVYVGSANFDPRSEYDNLEFGVVVNDLEFAKIYERDFEHLKSQSVLRTTNSYPVWMRRYHVLPEGENFHDTHRLKNLRDRWVEVHHDCNLLMRGKARFLRRLL